MKHSLQEPLRALRFEGRSEIPCLNMVPHLRGASAEVYFAKLIAQDRVNAARVVHVALNPLMLCTSHCNKTYMAVYSFLSI